jgi:excisionase family DNA binding protein
MKVETEKLLTVAQASRLAGVSRQALEQAIKEHRIKEVRIGGRVFIPIDQIHAYQADPTMIKLGKRRAKKGTNNK